MSKKFPIIEKAKRNLHKYFCGIAIPCDKTTVDGGTIRSEKILKFNRKALKNMDKKKVEKLDPRYNGGEDTMIIKVGKPGSKDRLEALAKQYSATIALGQELSPFGWDG
jgi:hypothetical protein